MRKSLMIVVALLATACLMAAMAYNSAVVTNAAELKVANTNSALLALGPNGGVGNKDLTAYIEDGNLCFDFGRGDNPFFGGDKNYGLQKNSVYTWWASGASNTGLFHIQNRSAETIDLQIDMNNIPAGVTIELRQSMGDGGSGPWWNLADGAYDLPRDLQSGWSCDVGVRITVGPNADMDTFDNLELVVGADAI